MLVKGSMTAGFIIAAVLVAVIVGMWLRVYYKGKKAQLIWSQMEGEKQSLARTMKGKDENKKVDDREVDLAFRAEKRADRTTQQRERALRQRYGNDVVLF